MEANKIQIKTLLISLGTIIGVEFVARVLISEDPHHPMIALGALRLVETILIFLIVSVWGNGISSMGLSWRTMGRGLKRGFVWSVAFGVLTATGFAVLFLAGIDPLALVSVRLPLSPYQIIVYFLVGGIVGPIAEEALFRGVLYGFLRRWGMIIAMTVSTLIFVMAHPSALHGIPLTQAVGGILFALAYEKEGNLLVPITIHGLGKIAIFALSLIF